MDCIFHWKSYLLKLFMQFQDHAHPNPMPNMTQKTKMAYWLVSHCKTENKREDYVAELQKYIDIDIYGTCGPLNFVKDLDKEKEILIPQYKFYIAFENSYCNEYVTEKFYHHIGRGIIPIVMGSMNYRTIAPEKSYIDVKDFKSPKDLADHLKFLDKYDGQYLKYFEWTKNVKYHVLRPMCELCKKLHDPSQPVQYYRNLSDWWIHDDKHNLDCEY